MTTLRKRTLAAVERHIESEVGNDIDKIMETVTTDCRYVLLSRSTPALLLQDADAAHQYYATSRSSYDVLSTHDTTKLVTDWYVFQESIVRFVHTGTLAGIPATGVEYTIPYAILFPVIEEGRILGEFPWGSLDAADAIRRALGEQTVPESSHEGLMAARQRSYVLMEEFIGRLRSGDCAGAAALFEENATCATRDYADDAPTLGCWEGRAAIQAHYEALFSRRSALEPEVLTWAATDWYAFCELEWGFVAADGDRSFRTGSLFAIGDNGGLKAEIGYGTDPALRP